MKFKIQTFILKSILTLILVLGVQQASAREDRFQNLTRNLEKCLIPEMSRAYNIETNDTLVKECTGLEIADCPTKGPEAQTAYEQLQNVFKNVRAGKLNQFVTFIRQPLSGDNLIYRSKECYPKVLTNGRVEYECATYFTCGCNSQKSNLTADATDYANRVNIECELVQFIIADSGQGLAKTYLNMIYKWVASIIGIIAVIYIIINGIIISTAQNDSGQVVEAKKRIFQSLASLAILMAASIILYAINPTFFIIPADTPTSTSTSTNP